VVDLPSDPQLLSVSPAHFEEQVKYISENYNPISLKELVNLKQKKNKIPDRTIAITFDDGYADNLWNMKPILEKYNVPATVFVTTGYVDTKLEFWWDDLERLILLPEKIPDTLTLTIDEKTHVWNNLGEPRSRKSQNSQEEGVPNVNTKYYGWDVTKTFFPEPKFKLYCDLHRLLRPLRTEKRQSVMNKIVSWSGLSDIGRPGYRALNRDELCKLSQGGLVDIGSHTMTHPVLKCESFQKQKDEIIESKQKLEEILDQEILSFSYPFGSQNDFSMDTVNLVINAGHTIACANYCGPVTQRTDQYLLPRYLVRNWNKDTFAQKVSEWFNG
jgi:peptidoglycan/xylan/chitin deacetylase (PgdA/CDA1 family)